MADHFRTEPDWNDVRYFLALARGGSLSAVARSMRVNHATVARRIAALEQAVGHSLFFRRPEGYRLTPQGEAMLESAAVMEDAARSLGTGAPAAAAAGLVRLTTIPSLAEAVIVPQLGRFAQQSPLVDIEILPDVRQLSLARHEADLAIRLGPPGDSGLVATRLGTLQFGLYSASVLVPGERLDFVAFGEAQAHLPQARWLAARFPEERVRFRASTHLAQAAAARAGLGIALLPHFLAAGLTPVLQHLTPPSREIWLLMQPARRKHPAVRALADFLIALFRADYSSPSNSAVER